MVDWGQNFVTARHVLYKRCTLKLNHLLPRHLESARCPSGKQHYWLPTGSIEAKLGDNIAVALFCKHCDKREWVFLSHNEYNMHKGVIDNAIQTNESTFANRVS